MLRMTPSMSERQVNIQMANSSSLINAISIAILSAEDLAHKSGGNVTVVDTNEDGICVYPDFLLKTRSHEIVLYIYSTDSGFHYAEGAIA